MSGRHLQRYGRSLSLVLHAMLLAGCEPGVAVLPSTAEPLVSIVLTNDPTPAEGRSDSSLTGLVATSKDPLHLSYRTVQRIEMVRRSDGRRFAWHIDARSGIIPIQGGTVYLSTGGNLRLDYAGTATELGRKDLTPGDAFDLVIESDGVLISGSARLSEAAVPVLRCRANGLAIVWPRVPGASSYLVKSIPATDLLQRADTEYVLRPPPGFGGTRIVVSVPDSTYMDFYAHPGKKSAGLTGALGLFATIAEAAATVSPDAVSACSGPSR